MSEIDLGNLWLEQGPQKIIVFCGLDGAGKTTQLRMLASLLESRGQAVLCSKQPTAWYRQDPYVRDYLDNGGNADQARVLALFAAADRRRHVAEVIVPALSRGEVVLLDRYVYSSLAYFEARGIDMREVMTFNRFLPRPSAAFFIDVPVEQLKRRIAARSTDELRREEHDLAIAERVRQGFLRLAASGDLIRVDGTQPPALIHDFIKSSVDPAPTREGMIIRDRVNNG